MQVKIRNSQTAQTATVWKQLQTWKGALKVRRAQAIASTPHEQTNMPACVTKITAGLKAEFTGTLWSAQLAGRTWLMLEPLTSLPKKKV